MATRRTRAPTHQPTTSSRSPAKTYTLEVFLLGGPITEAFARANPVVARTLQVRGDQTLADLHRAIFAAFDRWEEHAYEFQLGDGPHDPAGPRYVLPEVARNDARAAGLVTWTTLDALGLASGRRFGYWFDYGDDWWHQINVLAVGDTAPDAERLPRVIARTGASPPQYPDAGDDAPPARPVTPPRRPRARDNARPKTAAPRFRFALNPYHDARFTRCPVCDRPTRLRKFALAVRIEPDTLVVQGLTCRFCAGDELIICHQDVLEANLAGGLAHQQPGAVGRPYTVVGIVDHDVWRRSLGQPVPSSDVLRALHPFREVVTIVPARPVWTPK